MRRAQTKLSGDSRSTVSVGITGQSSTGDDGRVNEAHPVRQLIRPRRGRLAVQVRLKPGILSPQSLERPARLDHGQKLGIPSRVKWNRSGNSGGRQLLGRDVLLRENCFLICGTTTVPVGPLNCSGWSWPAKDRMPQENIFIPDTAAAGLASDRGALDTHKTINHQVLQKVANESLRQAQVICDRGLSQIDPARAAAPAGDLNQLLVNQFVLAGKTALPSGPTPRFTSNLTKDLIRCEAAGPDIKRLAKSKITRNGWPNLAT
jgi:hypothetical protein